MHCAVRSKMVVWIIVVLLFQIVKCEQVTKNTKDVFSIEERLEIPLRYCIMRNATDTVKKRDVFRHCLRKWNTKYARYCKKSRFSSSDACVQLKEKMENALRKFSASRTKTYTDHCIVGQTRNKTFDPTIQFCCENHIWKKKYREQNICCVKVHADGVKSKCCNSSFIALQTLKRAQCCRGKLINEDTETCENDVSNVTGVSTFKMVQGNNWPKNGLREMPTHVQTPVVQVDSYTSSNDETLRVNQRHEDMGAVDSNGQNMIIYVCSSILVLALLGFVLYLISKYRCMKQNKKSMLQCLGRNQPNSYGSTAWIQNTHNDLSENRITRPGLHLSDSLETKCEETSFNICLSNISEILNISPSVYVDSQTQTAPKKKINVQNSMGREFCVQHTFTKHNRTLQIPNSSVKLTLSEEDLQNEAVLCHASTFRNLAENYIKLDELMSNEEKIVSPAAEFFFPAVKRLKQFACVDMDIGGKGKDFHVWRVKSDQGRKRSSEREEIPLKKYVDINDDKVDAYYEIFGGKIRIFLKSFSWLVCTVCDSSHYGFNLSARVYVKNEPHTPLSKQVRVTVYILDGVRQVEDYLKFITEDTSTLKLFRRINLPEYVSLEESLSIRLFLLSETEHFFRPLIETDEAADSELVPIKYITQCHKFKSNGQPFSKDWHFESLPNSITSGKFTFQCMLSATIIRQDVDMNIPPTKYIINEEVDFSTIKKGHDFSINAADMPEFFWKLPRQPLSAFQGTARPTGQTEQMQRGYSQINLDRGQQPQINQNALPHDTNSEITVTPTIAMPNAPVPNALNLTGSSQIQKPVSALQMQNYEHLGARPKTTSNNREPENRLRNNEAPSGHRTSQTPKDNINNSHDSQCKNKAPNSCSEPDIRIDNKESVRGEFSRSMN